MGDRGHQATLDSERELLGLLQGDKDPTYQLSVRFQTGHHQESKETQPKPAPGVPLESIPCFPLVLNVFPSAVTTLTPFTLEDLCGRDVERHLGE